MLHFSLHSIIFTSLFYSEISRSWSGQTCFDRTLTISLRFVQPSIQTRKCDFRPLDPKIRSLFIAPFLFVSCYYLQYFVDGLIECLRQPVCYRIIFGGSMILVAKFLKAMIFKLGPFSCMNRDHVWTVAGCQICRWCSVKGTLWDWFFHLCQGNCLSTFWKIICHLQYEAKISAGWYVDRS